MLLFLLLIESDSFFGGEASNFFSIISTNFLEDSKTLN